MENYTSITNFVVRGMGEVTQPEEVLVSDPEEITLKSLKDKLLKELSKVTGELKDLRHDFDIKLTQTENKVEGFEKVSSLMQNKVQGVRQEVKQVVTETGKAKA